MKVPVNSKAIDMLIQSITKTSRIIKRTENTNFTHYFQAYIFLLRK